MFSKRATELFNDGNHRCYAYSDLVKGEAVQANQFLIVDNEQVMVLDPGGDLTYAKLHLEIKKLTSLDNLRYVFASHQDPDIIASIGSWMLQTKAQVICSKLWERFLPHFATSYLAQMESINLNERILGLDDKGAQLTLGDNPIQILPAHFLHSVGNFQLYDPVSKILFSGDMGASIVDSVGFEGVEDFEAHIPSMKGFHQRYMVSNKACRLWANMIRQLDVNMIVPQHGSSFVGKEQVNQFLDWISRLECGIDLMTQADYLAPN